MKKLSDKAVLIIEGLSVVACGGLTIATKLTGHELLWQVLMGATFIMLVITFQKWWESHDA